MDQKEELRYLLLAVQREGNRQFTEVLKPLNLTPAQAEVIQVLQQYQPMTLLRLGERLVCESGSPSRLVKAMVNAGWVEKMPNPDDGRAVLLQLTEQAEAILPQLNTIDAQFNEQVAAFADDEEIGYFLEKLWRYVEGSSSGQALRYRKQETE